MQISFQIEKWRHIWKEVLLVSKVQGEELGRSYGLDLDLGRYAAQDIQGLLHILTVRDEGTLVGWYINIVVNHPHYSSLLFGFMDTFYLLPQYRKGLTGLELFTRMQDQMRELGVKELIAISKYKYDTSTLFTHLGWEPEGITFSKVL